MDDALELLAYLRIGKNDLGQRGSIEPPVDQHSIPEASHDLGQSRCARLDDLTSQLVGIYDHRAAARQLIGDRGFPRANTAGEAHPQQLRFFLKPPTLRGLAAGEL